MKKRNNTLVDFILVALLGSILSCSGGPFLVPNPPPAKRLPPEQSPAPANKATEENAAPVQHGGGNVSNDTVDFASAFDKASLSVNSEAIRNPKHPFRKVDNQPKKPLKHRYERRKIKEYLHLDEVVSGEAA